MQKYNYITVIRILQLDRCNGHSLVMLVAAIEYTKYCMLENITGRRFR